MDILSAKKIIKAAALADDTVIMEGTHGIGKSNIVKQFAEENNYHLEELFLSHQEVGDLIGIPHMIETDEVSITTWSTPIWLQRMHKAHSAGQHCILFLDELNRAPIDVRQSALQLVLERKIHEHSLPILENKRTLIVAAVNPSDDYQVDELDPALLDRFLFIEVHADTKAWLEYSRKTNVNIIVRDFITEFPDRLNWVPKDGIVGATPRSWTKVGDFMDNVDEIPPEVLFQIMKGKVGTELASQFYSFYKNYVDVIKVQDIIDEVKNNIHLTLEEISQLIKEKMIKSEAIQKTEMANQLMDALIDDNIFILLVYLYSLEVEICIAFLKIVKSNNLENFKKIAKIDEQINGKKLFERIVQASDVT